MVDQGIKRVLLLRKTSRSSKLTDQDLFYREVGEGWGKRWVRGGGERWVRGEGERWVRGG